MTSTTHNTLQSIPLAFWHAFHRSTDLQRVEDAAVRIQAPIGTGRRILVTSAREKTGRTTLTAALAQTYSRFRPEPIGAVDLDLHHGSLGARLGSSATPRGHHVGVTADHVAQHVRENGTGSAESFLALLHLAPHRVHHTAARSTPQSLSAADTRDLLAGFSRFFPVTLTDCTPGYESSETRAALRSAHAVLHTLPADALAVDETLHFLLATGQHQRRLPEPSLVVAVVETTPHVTVEAKRVATTLRDRGFSVHHVPFDRQLNVNASVAPCLIHPKTHRVIAELAAELLERANSLPRGIPAVVRERGVKERRGWNDT